MPSPELPRPFRDLLTLLPLRPINAQGELDLPLHRRIGWCALPMPPK
jgi:hypothetical protein